MNGLEGNPVVKESSTKVVTGKGGWHGEVDPLERHLSRMHRPDDCLLVGVGKGQEWKPGAEISRISFHLAQEVLHPSPIFSQHRPCPEPEGDS